MRRNEKLVMEILELIEDQERGSMSASRIIEKFTEGDATTQEAVSHHLKIMNDRGLVEIQSGRVRLTWNGHDAVEQGPRRAKELMAALSR